MKNKLFQTSYFGFLSLAVVAPTARAAAIPGDTQTALVSTLSASLFFDQSSDAASVRPLETPSGPTPWAQLNRQSLKTETWPGAYVSTETNAPSQSKSEVVIEAAPVIVEPKPAPAPKPTKVAQAPEYKKSKVSLKKLTRQNEARVLVVDAQSLNFGVIKFLEGATLTWVGPESKIETKSGATGIAKAPFTNTRAQRFVVNAEGYLPAVGYAVNGKIAVAPMYHASLLAPLIDSLGIKELDHHIVIGKIFDQNLRPLDGLKMDVSQKDANVRVNYSLGSLFLTGMKATSFSGDFVVTGQTSAIQYFRPSGKDTDDEWPSTVVDLSGMPQVVSLAIPHAEREFAKTNLLDVFVGEQLEGGNITIGGQVGVYVPDAFGNIVIENLYERPAMDIFEVRATSYLKSWVHVPASAKLVPKFSPVLSPGQVQVLLEPVDFIWSPSQSVVIGMTEEYPEPVVIEVRNSLGEIVENARVIYFNRQNRADSKVTSTVYEARFVIPGLEDGEWSLVSRGIQSKKALDATIVRVSGGVVSFVEI